MQNGDQRREELPDNEDVYSSSSSSSSRERTSCSSNTFKQTRNHTEEARLLREFKYCWLWVNRDTITVTCRNQEELKRHMYKHLQRHSQIYMCMYTHVVTQRVLLHSELRADAWTKYKCLASSWFMTGSSSPPEKKCAHGTASAPLDVSSLSRN